MYYLRLLLERGLDPTSQADLIFADSWKIAGWMPCAVEVQRVLAYRGSKVYELAQAISGVRLRRVSSDVALRVSV